MKKHSILIVEDAQNWQNTLRRILENEGYQVATVGTYGEARTQLEAIKFDLAIVDLRLRSVHIDNVEGMDVVAEAYRKGIRSIVVTGFPTQENARKAFEEYAVLGFLDKEGTWNPDWFRELVKRGLRQRETNNLTGTSPVVNSVFTRQFILQRVFGVLDNIVAVIISSLLMYVIGVIKGVINADPRTWLGNLPSIIYILLSVIVVLVTVLVYTLWKHNRRK